MYQVFKESLNSKPKFIPFTSKNIQTYDLNKDYYISLFQFTEEQKKLAEAKGSIKGIKDTTTNKLYFDFDSKDNLEAARQDAITLAKRLTDLGISPDDIHACFTGCKGFSIEIKLNKRITNPEFKAAVTTLAGDLKTFDWNVMDPVRIVRVDNTLHLTSKLYKTPLSLVDLDERSIEEIITEASECRNYQNTTKPVSIPDKYFIVKEKEVSSNKPEVADDIKSALDTKPKHWKDYKWSLAQGFFESGERHSALMVIAATCRGLGYDKDTAYYICKSALKKQAARSGSDEFSKEELYENIIEQSVYADGWEGGQYSPKTNPWLKSYCERMGFDTEQKEEESAPAISLNDMTGDFHKFAKDFESNILKTGIRELDDNATLCVSTLNGLLGQPGAGKTSMAINYLKHTSDHGIPSMFFSLDMGKQIVYAKLVQKETGLDFKKALELYRTDPDRAEKVAEALKNDYKNVGFNFRSGITVPDIRKAIREHQASIGQKVKLVIVDYLECIAGPLADSTANAGLVANQLKDVANEEEVCILLLLQTQKHSTPDVSDPLLTLKGVKGSSLIEQSMSSIVTLWREGYSPKYVNDDKYISFAVVKNRFGGLWSGDFAWKGITGDIRSLTEEERDNLKAFKKRKKEEKAAAELKNQKEWE